MGEVKGGGSLHLSCNGSVNSKRVHPLLVFVRKSLPGGGEFVNSSRSG